MKMNGRQTYSSLEKWWESVTTAIDECSFVLLHVNVRSLKKHWNKINSRVEPYLDKLDVIVFFQKLISKQKKKHCFFLKISMWFFIVEAVEGEVELRSRLIINLKSSNTKKKSNFPQQRLFTLN